MHNSNKVKSWLEKFGRLPNVVASIENHKSVFLSGHFNLAELVCECKECK